MRSQAGVWKRVKIMNQKIIKFSIIIIIVVLALFTKMNGQQKQQITFSDRIAGMTFASAVADAMAGPHEGRRTQVSQEFLENGGWIKEFYDYTPGYQHYWNVYSRTAPAGTYTDDTRLRALIAHAMAEYNNQYPDQYMTRRFLADYIFSQYQDTYASFQEVWHKLHTTEVKATRQKLDEQCKEKFLHLWFLWEIVKTATEVFIPQNPPIYSPPALRIAESEWTHKPWYLKSVTPEKVKHNIKATYHFNTYENGQEMPLGLIAILPLAIYFPGDAPAAFEYIYKIDFFDIKNAPLYPAVIGAMLADLLGDRMWDDIIYTIKTEGIEKYVACYNQSVLTRIQKDIDEAISISQTYKNQPSPYARDNYIQFIKTLHKQFAVGEIMMCTVDEMLSVSVAIMDYAPPNLKQLIEMAVNYGRDNDTVASIVACLGGAAYGVHTLPQEWINKVTTANPEKNLPQTVLALAQMSSKKSKH